MNLAWKLISEELNIFETKFKVSVKVVYPARQDNAVYSKKKRETNKSMFVLLSSKLCGGITETTYRAASLVELVHTASLVHDDVVDEAYERRFFNLCTLEIQSLRFSWRLSFEQGLLLSWMMAITEFYIFYLMLFAK